MNADRKLGDIAEFVADGVDIDWDAERADCTDDQRATLDRLELLDRMRRALDAPDEKLDSIERLEGWGHLRILDRLGAGASSIVFRAHDPTLNRDVALKLRTGGPSRPEDDAAWIQEARRLARVRHPNVVAVHGADVHDGVPGLWCDRVEGTTLGARNASRPPSDAEALDGAEALLSAVVAVHRAGLIHGDIKPDNVMCDTGGRLLLMDFGAAARLDGPGRAADRAGTPLAMAPERFDRAALTPAVDVFGAGVVLYHWLEGRYPVIGSTATAIREQWARGVRLRFRRRGGPAALRRLIRTMLAADPDDRPTARSALRSIRRMRSAPVRRLRLGAALTVIGGLAIALIVSLTALDTADRAQRETEAVNRFLLDVLAAPRRTRLGPNLPLSALLEDSAARAEAQLADQPAALAGVLGTIGTGFVKLQRYDRAAELLERAERLFQELERDVQAVDVRLARADLAMNEARFDQARQIHRRILSGLPSDDALSAMQRARAQIGLGQVELAAGRLEQARAELSSAFEMLDREPSIPNAPSLRAAALLALGELELRAGGYAAAREALEQAQAHFLAEVGPRHHNAAVARTSLIEALDRLGRLDEAAALAEQNVAINIDWLGPSDRLSIAALDALANIHSRRGDIDRALEVNAAALADASSDDPMLSLQLESNRVAYLLDAGQLRAALRLADDLLPRLVEDLGAGHTLTWTTALNKADALLAAGRPIDALSLARDLDRRIRARFGASHLFSRVAGYLIGGSLSATGEFEAAERLLVDHHAALDAQLGRSHPLTLKAAGLLAEHWQRVGRTEDARMLAGSAAQRAREALGPRHQRSRDLEALVQRLQSED